LVVKYGSKTRWRSSAGMPGHVGDRDRKAGAVAVKAT